MKGEGNEMTLWETYPCPKCGKAGLVYEGMLAWRHGPRPPRKLARKDLELGAGGDYERENLYHCSACGAQFFEDVEQRGQIHLYEEGNGKYLYNQFTARWQRDVY